MKKSLSINTKNFFLFFIIIPELFLTKIIQFTVLPSNFFYDSNIFLILIKHVFEYRFGDNYNTTALIFKNINFLNFTTLKQWAYAMTIFFGLIILIILLVKFRNKKPKSLLFLYMSIGLAGIYIFGLTKDVIQFSIFMLIILIVECKVKNWIKVLLSFLILIFEGIFYREYFMITALMFLISFLIINNLDKKSIKKNILIIMIVFLLGIYLIQYISPMSYSKIFNARDMVTDVLSANTEIVNLIPNPNNQILPFVGNYFINLIRILFPIELLFKGKITYMFFIIYQLIITINMFLVLRKLKEMKNTNINIYCSLLIAYLLVSVLFEPDFGSVVRHESTLFLVYYFVFSNYYLYKDSLKKVAIKNE